MGCGNLIDFCRYKSELMMHVWEGYIVLYAKDCKCNGKWKVYLVWNYVKCFHGVTPDMKMSVKQWFIKKIKNVGLRLYSDYDELSMVYDTTIFCILIILLHSMSLLTKTNITLLKI